MRYRRTQVPGGTLFLTLVTFDRSPLFRSHSAVEHFRAAIRKVQAGRPFVVDAAVILPDHIHVLWTLPDGDTDYPTRVRLLKTHFTKLHGGDRCGNVVNASRALKGERNVWQRRYWEHTIRDEKDFQAHADYIHYNPVRHGYVAAARDWPHSTFHDWMRRGIYDLAWGTDELPALLERVGHE